MLSNRLLNLKFDRSRDSMTRCDYDTIFQRVFCVTLIAIGVAFTVILTNIFVDIDGLLSKKDKAKHFDNTEPIFDDEKQVKVSLNAIIPSLHYKQQERLDEQNADKYRSKRSLDSQNFLLHVRNPKVKSILTSRLATLLEELDEEESTIHENSKNERPAPEKEIEDMNKKENSNDAHKNDKTRHDSSDTEDDLLHLAMHNILLQGIIGHMDLNEVYRKVHLLINNFKKTGDNDEVKKRNLLRKQATPVKQILNEMLDRDDEDLTNKENDNKIKRNDISNKSQATHKPSAEEIKFLNEMAGCDKLNTEIKSVTKIKTPQKADTKKPKYTPNVLIKTIIDITSLNRNKSQKHENNDSKERVKGIIQLIYNGKAIQFSRMDDDDRETTKKNTDSTVVSVTDATQNGHVDNAVINDAIEVQDKQTEKTDTYLNSLLGEYLTNDPEQISNFLEGIESRRKFKTRRHKRQIKIRYKDDKTKAKNISLANTDDNELYVEIETHFDSKGMKGEKKKKLIRNLIDKIQKAIHSDLDLTNNNKKQNKHERYQVKKRTQHPLDKNMTLFINKVMIPISNIVERHSDPISKTSTSIRDQIMPTITDRSGESWKKHNSGPAFLTVSKSVNSAELGELNIDYSKVSPMSGIPQRLQKPLNTDDINSRETTNFDMGELKFFIKDLDGTGLSIGFSQYTDERPDLETMKLFTSIEHMATSYNQDNYEKPNHEYENTPPVPLQKDIHDMDKRDIAGHNNQHLLIRRSIKELDKEDYHSNEYKIIYDGNFLPYNNYEEVIQNNKKRITFKINKDDDRKFDLKDDDGNLDKYSHININEIPVLMGDNIFYKKLKPAEILNLANILTRKKRGVTVKKITNIKSKMKLNKFINRRGRFDPKKLILSKKRSKRQINNIRIITTDALGNPRHNGQSAENVLLVSDENLLADRAVIREVVDTPNNAMREMAMKEDKAENLQEATPYMYQDSSVFRRLGGRYRTNGLMSRYPHIIMEEISKSNEEFVPQTIDRIEQKTSKPNHIINNVFDSTTEANLTPDMPNFEEIVRALEPFEPKQNYKLTVKIMPRNASAPDLGFKEMHTSINKSFNKNGKIYSSMYNISELSKIEDLKPKTPTNVISVTATSTTPMPLSTKPHIANHEDNQQVKLDYILREHQKKIDEQLEHLKKEREKIEILAVKNKQFNPMETFQEIANKTLPRFDINHLIALMKLKTPGEATTQPATTTVAVTTTPGYLDLEKIKIINTIRRNENLTNEILHQINKNTAILQDFLSKLSDRLPPPVLERVKDTSNGTEEEVVKTEETDKTWKPFNLRLPNANNEHLTNDSHAPIPFVYAFQRPYPVQHKSKKPPIASIVYYGHIHTGTFKDPNDIRRVDEDGNNQTKYFLDDVGNGFKEIIRNDLDKVNIALKNSSSLIN
ncbi:hypothetical protein evm_003738 [Chilo suppressalis]|nr:hypothetical protein evm_003738 [Chilo suppressalis]